MYCEKCNKQSPDNFTNCAYCGAKFKSKKTKQSVRFSPKKREKAIPFKSKVLSLIIVALVLAVASIVTAFLTGQKPEKIVKTIVTSTENADAQKYYGIFDDYIKKYKKDNFYFEDGVTFDEMTKPLKESDEFYKSRCGEGYKITYDITELNYLTDEKLDKYNEYLVETYGYKRSASSAAVLDVRLNVKGEKGDYTTVYKNMYCLKLSGKWYLGEAPEET